VVAEAEAVVVVVDRVVVVGTKNYSNKKRPDLSGLFFSPHGIQVESSI